MRKGKFPNNIEIRKLEISTVTQCKTRITFMAWRIVMAFL